MKHGSCFVDISNKTESAETLEHERSWLQNWEEVSQEEGTPQWGPGLVEEESFEEGVKTRRSGPLVCVAMTTGNPVMLGGTPLNSLRLDFSWSEG